MPVQEQPATRRRILTAATDEFAKRGFHGTTTRDIVRAAGLSPAALYIHFPSKEELLFTLMREGHQRLLDDMSQADKSMDPSDIEGRLKAVVRAHAIYHARELNSARVSNQGLQILSAANHRVVLDLRRRVEAVLDNILKLGVDGGIFVRDNTRMTLFFILSANIGVARWYSPSGSLTPEAIADHFADCALRMVRV